MTNDKILRFSDSQFLRFKKNPLSVVCCPLTFIIFAEIIFSTINMRVRHESDNPEFVVSAVVETMQELKAKEVVSLDLRDIHSAVTDYFVICHAQSKTQVSAIADRILDNLRDNHHVKPYHYEGFENSEWILLDYIDVVVHVFLEPKREFYKLESLWADAERTSYED